MDPNWKFSWKDARVEIPEEQLEAVELDFRAGFLHAALESRPDDRELLAELGEILTRQGRHAEGLEVDLKLSRLFPEDASILYNLACSLALTGQPVPAVKALKKAVRRGFCDFELLEKDGDLATLRELPEFRALLEKTRKAT